MNRSVLMGKVGRKWGLPREAGAGAVKNKKMWIMWFILFVLPMLPAASSINEMVFVAPNPPSSFRPSLGNLSPKVTCLWNFSLLHFYQSYVGSVWKNLEDLEFIFQYQNVLRENLLYSIKSGIFFKNLYGVVAKSTDSGLKQAWVWSQRYHSSAVC